jgi:hypothetical protein
MRFIGILGGHAGPKRSSTCFSLTDPSGSGSGVFQSRSSPTSALLVSRSVWPIIFGRPRPRWCVGLEQTSASTLCHLDSPHRDVRRFYPSRFSQRSWDNCKKSCVTFSRRKVLRHLCSRDLDDCLLCGSRARRTSQSPRFRRNPFRDDMC